MGFLEERENDPVFTGELPKQNPHGAIGDGRPDSSAALSPLLPISPRKKEALGHELLPPVERASSPSRELPRAPETAYDKIAITGQAHPNRVGGSAFSELVFKGGRELPADATATFDTPIMAGSRIATVTRHRSGSLTEVHRTAGKDDPGTHRAYHFSATTNTVSTVDPTRGSTIGKKIEELASTQESARKNHGAK